MKIDKEVVGKRIKEALDKAGVSQRRLSQALNLSDPSITAYVQGTSEPSAQGFAVIAELCGVTIDWLITGRNPEIEQSNTDTALTDRQKKGAHLIAELAEEYGIKSPVALPGPAEDQLNNEEKRLIAAFRGLSDRARKRELEGIEELAGFTREERKPKGLRQKEAAAGLSGKKNVERFSSEE